MGAVDGGRLEGSALKLALPELSTDPHKASASWNDCTATERASSQTITRHEHEVSSQTEQRRHKAARVISNLRMPNELQYSKLKR